MENFLSEIDQKCPECGGSYEATGNSFYKGHLRKQYACRSCGHRFDTQVD